jgi:hypothetical protein
VSYLTPGGRYLRFSGGPRCGVLFTFSSILGLSLFLFHQYRSTVTTFDILRNFANLSQQALRDLEDVIDDPSNGFLLDRNSYDGFDNFQWCLQETEVRANQSRSSLT